MSERFADLFRIVDPRLRSTLQAAVAQPGPAAVARAGQTIVLAGHRSAGKSGLLPGVSALTGRTSLDLDRELERRHGRMLRTWVVEAHADFRRAERALFESLPPGGLVAVGGGFLSHHADALQDALTVLVPISFETYCRRLSADRSRPRLRPELTLQDELTRIYEERELLHARVPTVKLEDFLRGLAR